jgi:hypothetical protein
LTLPGSNEIWLLLEPTRLSSLSYNEKRPEWSDDRLRSVCGRVRDERKAESCLPSNLVSGTAGIADGKSVDDTAIDPTIQSMKPIFNETEANIESRFYCIGLNQSRHWANSRSDSRT